MLRILCSLMYVKCTSFRFTDALDLKRILNILKNLLRQVWNSLTLQLSLWLREYDRAYFASLFRQKRQSLIYLQFCEYFVWV